MTEKHDARRHKADLLLQQSQRYESGRLSLFLGAAPGVGKTYAMLVRAHELAAQGQDIVLVYIENHGRVETENLQAGLPSIARKKVYYQGQHLEEMDLDAVLALKPSMVLVDELAHSNIPGSRHCKRWQDVNELLDAGIDVLSTMNIQHLESLNDVVLQMTGIRVTETVPDRVLGRLRDIRLIDLAVDELLERLAQGKVYLPEHAAQARLHFFNPRNLTALRELAMQTVASYVDSDVRENFALQGQIPRPLKNHILLVLEDPAQAEALVRMACRMAEQRQAQWTVLCFRLQDQLAIRTEQGQKRQLDQALHLARQLGAMTESLYGKVQANSLMDYVLQKGMSTLVMAQPKRQGLLAKFQPNLAQQITRLEPPFELSLVPLTLPKQVKKKSAIAFYLSLREALYVAATTILSIVIATAAERYLGIDDFSLIFITAVVFIASKTRMFAAVLAAILFFFAYNFFFISPEFTLQISARQGVITVLAFLGAALLSSRLASRLKQQVTALKAANNYNSIMQELGQQLSTAVDVAQVQSIASTFLKQKLLVEVWMYIPHHSTAPNVFAALSDKERISAEWSYKQQQASGRFTQTLSENAWWFLPILAAKQCLGVIGLKFPTAQQHLTATQQQLAEAMLEYIAQALLRTQLVNDLEQAKITTETEKLRSALLSSVSHDLRSPLAAMIGAADTLRSYAPAMSMQDRQDLLDAIHLEGERLDRYIQNLLDMTRLGHEGLSLKRDWIGVDELIGSAIRRLKRYMPDSEVELLFTEAPQNLFVHAALIEQAIFNVLENAAKFSPVGSAVHVEVSQPDPAHLDIMIRDQGQGIPEDEREQIFDMFYTMQRGDRGQYGTGLGLTIVKAIIAAHMGQIWATAGLNQKGTCICIRLPLHL